ncbi:MAG: hypothetical protein AB7K52_09485 [Phycisphaerales bacterium]
MLSPLSRGSVVARVACSAALGASMLLLGGCFGYNNVEPIDGAVGFENPNSPPVPQAMATALQWVALRYPPGMDRLEVGPERPLIAVNFPVGARRDTCEYVCRNTGPWASPLTRENDTLPVYHIARVWTRGLYATVDIYRPASQLGPTPEGAGVPGADGGSVLYQCITVQLRSGIGSYDVYAHRVWPIGSFTVPGLHYLEPGHNGRTQPAEFEPSGTIPPLPGEPRTRATGAEAPFPSDAAPARDPREQPARPDPSAPPSSPAATPPAPGGVPTSTDVPPGLQPPRTTPADDMQGTWPRN